MNLGTVVDTVFSGDAGLARTFWGWGVLGIPIVYITMVALIILLPKSGEGVLFTMMFGVLASFLASLAFAVWISISVWRAANKYTGPLLWAHSAKLAAVLLPGIPLVLFFSPELLPWMW